MDNNGQHRTTKSEKGNEDITDNKADEDSNQGPQGQHGQQRINKGTKVQQKAKIKKNNKGQQR